MLDRGAIEIILNEVVVGVDFSNKDSALLEIENRLKSKIFDTKKVYDFTVFPLTYENNLVHVDVGIAQHTDGEFDVYSVSVYNG